MYIYDSRIRYTEVDQNEKLTLESLLDYFQDCSTFHSEDLGVGLDYLMDKHLAWVLNMWQIEILRYPKFGECVEIGTAPYDFKGFIGYRNFLMKTKQGEMLACANTIWTLLDMDTGKPAMPPEEMKNAYVTEEKLDMEYLPRKIKLPESGSPREQIQIARHHLDTNKHVNNGQYVRMALELLPEELEINRLRVEYKAQAYLNDIICPTVYNEENIYTVALSDTQGKPFSVVQIAAAQFSQDNEEAHER